MSDHRDASSHGRGDLSPIEQEMSQCAERVLLAEDGSVEDLRLLLEDLCSLRALAPPEPSGLVSGLLDELVRKVGTLIEEANPPSRVLFEQLALSIQGILEASRGASSDRAISAIESIDVAAGDAPEGAPPWRVEISKHLKNLDHVLSSLRSEPAEEVEKVLPSVLEEIGELLQGRGESDMSSLCHQLADASREHGYARIAAPLHQWSVWLQRGVRPGDSLNQPCWNAEPLANQIKELLATDLKGATRVRESAVDVEFLDIFLAESEEHLQSAEQHLLRLEEDPGDAEALRKVFRAFHTLKGAAAMVNVTEVSHLSHGVECVLSAMRSGRMQVSSDLLTRLLQSTDLLEEMFGIIRESRGQEAIEPERITSFLGTLPAVSDSGLLDSRPDSSCPPVAPDSRESSAEVPARSAEAESPPSQPAPGAREGADPRVKPGAPVRAVESRGRGMEVVKVGATALDGLLNSIGELVIAESMVRRALEDPEISRRELLSHSGQLGKISRDLQQLATTLRMVPVRSTFQRMSRVARDAALNCGKDCVLRLEGEDTQIDRAMVDALVDPLLHLVRNAIDHGIESPETRAGLGKPPTGTVVLRAFHRGGNIYIEIEDDGKGLDRDGILARAVEVGLIQPQAALSDRELLRLVFEPGFSTASRVTGVSGRGVGMDVAKRCIDALRGTITARSEFGKGTTFSIRLPVTLAIIDGMIVRTGNDAFIIPILSIVRSVQPRREELTRLPSGKELILVEGELVPLLRLGEFFEIEGHVKDPTEGMAVIVEFGSRKLGILTDEPLGQHQIVIKGLEGPVGNARGIAGSAILPNGRVGLILDIESLMHAQSDIKRDYPEPVGLELAGATASEREGPW